MDLARDWRIGRTIVTDLNPRHQVRVLHYIAKQIYDATSKQATRNSAIFPEELVSQILTDIKKPADLLSMVQNKAVRKSIVGNVKKLAKFDKSKADMMTGLEKLVGQLSRYSNDVNNVNINNRVGYVQSQSQIAGDLLAMLKKFPRISYMGTGNVLEVLTDKFTLTDDTTRPPKREHIVGPFVISWSFGTFDNSGANWTSRYRINDEMPDDEQRRYFGHPHVRSEILCEGDGKVQVRAAMHEGRVFDFFDVLMALLSSYNTSSPHWRFSTEASGDPPLRRFADRNTTAAPPANNNAAAQQAAAAATATMPRCARCTRHHVVTDARQCHCCESSSCPRCTMTCNGCQEIYCVGCRRECCETGAFYCDSCMSKCPVCQSYVCAAASFSCSGCKKVVCRRHKSSCGECGEVICNRCVHQRLNLGGGYYNYCANHKELGYGSSFPSEEAATALAQFRTDDNGQEEFTKWMQQNGDRFSPVTAR